MTHPIEEVEPTQITVALPQNTAVNTNNRLWTVAAHYNNGPMLLGASYERNKLQDRYTTLPSVDSSHGAGNIWNVAGAYNFGIVRVERSVWRIQLRQNTFASGSRDQGQAQAMDRRTLGSCRCKQQEPLVYAKANVNYINAATDDDSLSMWGAAYFHN